ncbi:hypothetical protein H5T87_04485 [bacterium]|nr:hypothetical protein [bacterium]
MLVSTDNKVERRKVFKLRGNIIPFITIFIMLILLVLPFFVLIYSKGLAKVEKVVDAICSWAVLIPGILLFLKRRHILFFVRYLFFAILMCLINALALSGFDFHPPLLLLMTTSLWSLAVPFHKLYSRSFTNWIIFLLDLLLIVAFLPYIPVFHYASFLLLMCLPMALLTWTKGFWSGLAGFIPLLMGLSYIGSLNYQDAGLFLLIWSPILGGTSSALGLLIMDYKRLKSIVDRLEIFQRVNKEILSEDSFREGIKTMVKYILTLIPVSRYYLRLNTDDMGTFILTSSDEILTTEEGRIAGRMDIFKKSFDIAEAKGEIILEREEEFTPEEEELLSEIFEEITPSMEKLYYFEKAIEAAISDSLTSLANRRYFLYRLREEMDSRLIMIKMVTLLVIWF